MVSLPVSADIDWGTTALALNPANAVLHATTGALAQKFERYVVDYVELEYVPSVANTTSGRVSFSYHANPKTVLPTTEQDASVCTAFKAGPAREKLLMRVPVRQSYPWLYTRTGDNTPAGAQNDYGVIFVSTAGAPADDTALGTLYVSYRYRLMNLIKDAQAPL